LSITIKKLENKILDNCITTNDYGVINIVESIDANYIQFDSIHDYNLFIKEDATNIVAIKHNLDSLIEVTLPADDVQTIQANYNVDTVYWAQSDNAIIIKNDDENILYEISQQYEDKYNISFVTNTILFLELPDEIELHEETDAVDKVLGSLDDTAIKNAASKTKVKLQGTENRDTLTGIIKGALST